MVVWGAIDRVEGLHDWITDYGYVVNAKINLQEGHDRLEGS